MVPSTGVKPTLEGVFSRNPKSFAEFAQIAEMPGMPLETVSSPVFHSQVGRFLRFVRIPRSGSRVGTVTIRGLPSTFSEPPPGRDISKAKEARV